MVIDEEAYCKMAGGCDGEMISHMFDLSSRDRYGDAC